MQLKDFVFKHIGRFVPMPQQEYEQLKNEVSDDLETIRITESIPPGASLGYKCKWYIKKYTAGPYARLLLAVLFIPSTRWILDFMNPKQDDDKKSDDREYD